MTPYSTTFNPTSHFTLLHSSGAPAGVAGATATNGASSDGDAAVAGFLTPDALMAYCATKLRDIDSQVNTLFATQQLRNHSSQTLTDLQTAIGKYTNTNIDGAGSDAQALKGKFEQAIKDTAKDPSTQAAIIKQYEAFCATARQKTDPNLVKDFGVNANPPSAPGDSDASVDGKEFQAMSDALKSAQSDINSSNELDMIKLQALMSQRQTAVSSVTNIASKIDETLNQQAQKI